MKIEQDQNHDNKLALSCKILSLPFLGPGCRQYIGKFLPCFTLGTKSGERGDK